MLTDVYRLLKLSRMMRRERFGSSILEWCMATAFWGGHLGFLRSDGVVRCI